MYNVLIVDDEYLVILGIINCIKWDRYGFNKPFEATNGSEALEIIKKENIDLLITDIKMAPMDGIELMMGAKKIKNDLEVIILSCYNDFEYTRQAIQNGACDYLFKPAMMPKDIISTIEKAKAKIDEKKRRKVDMSKLENKLLTNEPIVKNELLFNLLGGMKFTGEELIAAFKEMKIQFMPGRINILFFILENVNEIVKVKFLNDEYLFKFAVLNIFNEMAEKSSSCEVVFKSIQEYVFIISSDNASNNDLHSKMSMLAVKVMDKLNETLGLSSSCGISSFNHSIEDIKNAYNQAFLSADRGTFSRIGKPIFFEDNLACNGLDKNTMEEILTELYEIDDISYSTKIKHIFSKLSKHNEINIKDIAEICANMITILLHNSMLNKNGLGYIYSKRENIFLNLNNLKQLKEFENYIISISEDIEDYLRNSYRHEIMEAKKYILEKMSNPELSLEDVSKYVNLSKNYFSHLFKETTGESYITFLNRIRIEKANELYENTDLKAYQIAEKVGYTDWRYFSKVYKKYTGNNLSDNRKNKKSTTIS